MATTTNYGWTTPNDTDLVKDGAAAIRTLGTAIDTTVYNNASAIISKTIFDAKGDIIAATANDTIARLAVGTNGQVLTADSTATTGIKWADSSGGLLQVVQGTYGTQASSTGSTFADTGLSATITPTKSTSKILVMQFTANCLKGGADTYLTLQLVRNSTPIHVISGLALGTSNTNTGITSLASSYLDSPATTSAVTYKTQFGNRVGGGSGTVYVNYTGEGGAVVSTIILMEIGV